MVEVLVRVGLWRVNGIKLSIMAGFFGPCSHLSYLVNRVTKRTKFTREQREKVTGRRHGYTATKTQCQVS